MPRENCKLSFDERNDVDFDEITRRINVALDRIEREKRQSCTEKNLARLAECSRGTLRNRIWPLSRLKTIKSDRASEQTNTDIPTTSEDLNRKEIDIDQLGKKLDLSRDEALRWKFKHDECLKKLGKALTDIEFLKGHLVALDQSNKVAVDTNVKEQKIVSIESRKQTTNPQI